METRTEPVVGWRNYQLFQPHFLISQNLVHRPRVKSEAWCQHLHLAPCETCSCGLYSFKNLEALVRDGYHASDFIAQVKFWGKIIEHEQGYKAQFSYPAKIWATSDKAKMVVGYIGFLYGIEVGKIEELKLDSLVIEYRSPFKPPSKPKPPAPLTMEQLIYAAFNENLELDLRRFARTKASVMLKPRIDQLENTINKLQDSVKMKTIELKKKKKLQQALRDLKTIFEGR